MTNTRCLQSLLYVLSMLVQPAAVIAQPQATFHVSPRGKDTNPGTEAKPFATIERARKAVRTINQEMTGDIEVILHDGRYRISETIAFDADDSGTGGHNIIYRAAEGQKPAICGGVSITGWKQDKQGRWKAPSPLDDFRQLYVGGHRATRARGPAPAGLELSGEDGYTTTAVEMADWRNVGDLEFCYWVVWSHSRCKVKDIKRDGQSAVITMLQPHFMYARKKEGVHVEMPNYIENALELLDEPGEWYLDRAAKTVYYIPREGEDMTKIEVIAPAVEKLVELRGSLDRPVQNIQFIGIAFEHATWLLPSQIGLADVQANFVLNWKRPMWRDQGITAVHNEQLKSPANIVCHAAHAIRFERCTFRNLGGAGIDIEVGSQDNALVGCRFHDIAGSAVQIGDILQDDHHPDDMRKIVKNNSVENCYIHDCCLDYMGGVGIFVGYTEATVLAHNEITRLPYSGISMGWGWGEEDAGGGAENYYMPYKYATPTPAKDNRIEYNHIYGVMDHLQDGGGIYTLGNMPGTIIRGNHVHDNPGVPGGIYLDEGSGFIEITGNLVYNVQTPMNYNNRNQDRISTCNEHDNFFGVHPDEASEVVKAAGLHSEYRDLLEAQ